MVTFHPSMDNHIFMIKLHENQLPTLPTYLPTYLPTHLPTYPPTYLPMENDILKISYKLLLFFSILKN